MRLTEPQLASLLRRNDQLSIDRTYQPLPPDDTNSANGIIGPHSILRKSEDAPTSSSQLDEVSPKQAQTEEQMQRQLIEYCRLRSVQDSIWSEVFHVPSGGLRHKAVAGKLKALGVRRGLLDLYWLVPRGKFHGFALELKCAGGRLTPEQHTEIHRLHAHGYLAVCVWSLEDAIDGMEGYYACV